MKEQERARKEKERAQREVEKESRIAFKARWTKEAIRQAGERLQDLVKNPPPRAPGDYIAPYLGNLPSICKSNMALQLAKRRAQKFNSGDPHHLPNGTPPAWVHRPDPRYMGLQDPDCMPALVQPVAVPCGTSTCAPNV